MAELNTEQPVANVNPQAQPSAKKGFLPFTYNGVTTYSRVDDPTHPLDMNLIKSLMSQQMPSSLAGEQQAIFGELMNRSRARRLGAYQASLVEPTIGKISELQKMTAQKGAEMEGNQMKLTNIARLADAIAKDPSANNRNMYAAFAKMYGGALDPMNAGVLQGSDLYKLKQEDEKFNLEKDLYEAKKSLIAAQTAESAARAEAYRSGGGGGRSYGGGYRGGMTPGDLEKYNTYMGKTQEEFAELKRKIDNKEIRGPENVNDAMKDFVVRKKGELVTLINGLGPDDPVSGMLVENYKKLVTQTNAYGSFGEYVNDI